MKAAVKSAKQHHSFKETNVAALSEDQVDAMVMRPIADVARSLAQYYDGDLYEVQGNDYIPWNITADMLNNVFGFFGWQTDINNTNTVQRKLEKTNKDTGEVYETQELLFTVSMRLTVRALAPSGSVIEKYIENVGCQLANSSPNGLDTAYKGAASDALSRCAKELGPRFGLFLYEKETYDTTPAVTRTNIQQQQRPQQQAQERPQWQPPQQQKPQQQAPQGGSIGNLSPARAAWLQRSGFSEADISSIGRLEIRQYKDLFDGLKANGADWVRNAYLSSNFESLGELEVAPF